MRFEQPRCPKCGELAAGTLETLTGRAGLTFDDDDTTADWEGSTEVFWDEQRTVRDRNGRVTLLCGCGADWQSAMTDGASVERGVGARAIDIIRDALEFVADVGFDDFTEWLRDEHRNAATCRGEGNVTPLVLPTPDEIEAARRA